LSHKGRNISRAMSIWRGGVNFSQLRRPVSVTNPFPSQGQGVVTH
jgi:hypothetical protein